MQERKQQSTVKRERERERARKNESAIEKGDDNDKRRESLLHAPRVPKERKREREEVREI